MAIVPERFGDLSKDVEPQGKTRILIVDDKPQILRFLKIKLIHSPYSNFVPILAGNKTEALRILKQASEEGDAIPIVVCDLNFFGDNQAGYGIAQAAKREKLTKYFILLTASQNLPDEDTLKEMGIDQVIRKPFDPNDFLTNLIKIQQEILNIKPLAA